MTFLFQNCWENLKVLLKNCEELQVCLRLGHVGCESLEVRLLIAHLFPDF